MVNEIRIDLENPKDILKNRTRNFDTTDLSGNNARTHCANHPLKHKIFIIDTKSKHREQEIRLFLRCLQYRLMTRSLREFINLIH